MSVQLKRTSLKQKSTTLMKVYNITNIKRRQLNLTQHTNVRRHSNRPPHRQPTISNKSPLDTCAPGDLTPWKQHKTRVHRRPTISRETLHRATLLIVRQLNGDSSPATF